MGEELPKDLSLADEDLPEDFSLDDHPKLAAALNEIAILANARATRDPFCSVMLVSLREARRLHLKEPEIRSAFPTWAAVDGDLEKTGLAAESLANRLRPADEARSHALEQLHLQLLASERDGNSPGPIAQILSELHHDKPLGAIAEILGELGKVISTTRCFLQKTKDDPATSVGYQTTNIRKHLGARRVIRALIIASEKMGTKLTFRRIEPDVELRIGSDVEGPLIEAISILKGADNFFSSGFFPERLRKICTDVRSELNRE